MGKSKHYSRLKVEEESSSRNASSYSCWILKKYWKFFFRLILPYMIMRIPIFNWHYTYSQNSKIFAVQSMSLFWYIFRKNWTTFWFWTQKIIVFAVRKVKPCLWTSVRVERHPERVLSVEDLPFRNMYLKISLYRFKCARSCLRELSSKSWALLWPRYCRKCAEKLLKIISKG